jgi:N-acetylmuramoyl-L-alanine amidase
LKFQPFADARRPLPAAAARRSNSDILFDVRISKIVALLTAATLLLAWGAVGAMARQQPQAGPPSAQETPAAPPAQTPPASPNPAPPVAPVGPMIVLDPAHGGTDAGARGEAVIEKDIVLAMARSVRAALERQGLRVVMTRNDDANPSYDDRAAMANAYRDAIFISLHASSTGQPGTVRAYSMLFASPAVPAGVAAASAARPAPAPALLSWAEAQRPYVTASHRLADLMQSEFAQAFAGSPSASLAVPVRALRSVTGPAVAIEISSVSTETPGALTASGEPLGNAIAKAVTGFRQAAGAAGAR